MPYSGCLREVGAAVKDLYRRIGLPASTDDRSIIERALMAASNTDAASVRAARHILLDPARKEVYDRTRLVLVRIGQLRSNLGLSGSPNGVATDCGDFDVAPSSTVSQLEALREHHRASEPLTDPLGPSGITQWVGMGVGAVILLSCVIGGVLVNETSPPPRTSAHSPAAPVATWYVPPQPGVPTHIELQPLVQRRAEKIRERAMTRIERAGQVPDSTMVEAAVQKLLLEQADPLPATGVISANFKGKGVAPLSIKTQSGTHYYVKVYDWNTKAEILAAFVRGGEPFETTVPVGSYEIKYAAGQSWYGPILDFGESAAYSRCDDRFDFTETFSGYNGFTIELIMQQFGNLETDPIAAEDF